MIRKLLDLLEKTDSLASLDGLLEIVAKESGSRGCIVWEEVPRENSERREDDRLFPLAQFFFEKELWRKTDIPVKGSLTGLALLTRKPQRTDDVHTDARTFKDDPWLHDIGPICAFPLSLRDRLSGLQHGAITFFRDKGAAPYAQDELDRLPDAVALLPFLAQSVRNRVIIEFLRDLHDLLGRHRAAADVPPHEADSIVSSILRDVGTRLVKAMRCAHLWIYLADIDRNTEDGVKLMFVHGAPTPARGEGEEPPLLPGTPGLVPWTLRTGQSILMLDLACWERDAEWLRSQKGLDDVTDRDFKAELARAGGKESRDPARARSFVSVPIMHGEKAVGAIACCEIESEPPYYTTRDRALLELVAQRLGPYIQHLRIHQKLRGETEVWRDLTDTMASLNDAVSRQRDTADL
jgi:hypothetical protein